MFNRAVPAMHYTPQMKNGYGENTLRNWGGNGSDENFIRLEAALAQYPAELRAIVNVVMLAHHKLSHEPGINVFHGGHVQLNDGMRFYHYVKTYVDSGSMLGYLYGGNWTRGGTRTHSQSHPTTSTPYEVTMPAYWLSGWGCLLFGTHPGGTWFQAEATSVKRGYGSMIYHVVKDFAAYKLSGQQQGPIGTSKASDKSPYRADASTSLEILRAAGI